MNAELLDKPIFTMTGREFIELQKMVNQVTTPEPKPEKNFKIGINGIAQIFNCSYRYAQVIKNSGKIDLAITQHGRKITVDAELAIKLYNRK